MSSWYCHELVPCLSAVTSHLFCYPALLWFWKWLCSHWLGRQPCYKWWCESQIWVTVCKYNSMETLTWVRGKVAVQTAAGCLAVLWGRICVPPQWLLLCRVALL